MLFAVTVVFAASLALANAYPLIDPDEGRNAEIAREMAASGDLIVPHLAGMPYLDKPPALFWAQAAAFRLFGVTPFAARVPAAIAAALILWIIGAFALQRAGLRHMTVTLGLLATAPLFFVLSAYVIFDMLLALCVTLVWVNLVREIDAADPAPRPYVSPVAAGVRDATRPDDDAPTTPPVPHHAPGWPTGRRMILFAAMAFGVLVKGPVMLAWCIGGGACAAIVARSWAPVRWLAWLPGWGLFFLLAGGWFALAVMRHPEYPAYAFVDETFRRMTTGAFRREQPWWFVPAVLAGGALPWSLGTPWGRQLGRASRVALGFILFAAVFFTVSKSKLVTYLLPVVPCMAWIAAEAWNRASGRRGPLGVAIVLALVAVTGVVFGLVREPWGTRIDGAVARAGMQAALGLAAVLAAAAIVALAGAWKSRPALAVAAAMAFTPAVLLTAGPTLRHHAQTQSGEPLARAIQQIDSSAVVRYEHTYSPGTDFILGRRSEMVSEEGRETTSNYQIFYRDSLVAREQWTPLANRGRPSPDVIVRPAGGRHAGVPGGWVEFFRDRRFAAYRPRP